MILSTSKRMQIFSPGHFLNDELQLGEELPVAAGSPYQIWFAINTRTSVSHFVKILPDGTFNLIQQDQIDQLESGVSTPTGDTILNKKHSPKVQSASRNFGSKPTDAGAKINWFLGTIFLLMAFVILFFLSTSEETGQTQVAKKVDKRVPLLHHQSSAPGTKNVSKPSDLDSHHPMVVSRAVKQASVDSTAKTSSITSSHSSRPLTDNSSSRNQKAKGSPFKKKPSRTRRDLFLPDPELNQP